MPELPEVETNRRELSKHILHKRIKTVEVLSTKQFIGDPQSCVGVTIVELLRHGKIMAIKLSNDLYINIHLKMTGQLLYADDSTNAVFKHTIPLANTHIMPGRSTRVIITFDDGSAVFFNDSRKFGWMKLAHTPEKPAAMDVISPAFTSEYFISTLQRTTKPVKTALLDQSIVAGIGNIYANESLFEAGILPTRPANSLRADEYAKLYKAVQSIIQEGIIHKGSSGKDESYLLPDGSRGMYQQHFRVYQRTDKPCPRCGNPILRITHGGRSSFYCSHCQK